MYRVNRYTTTCAPTVNSEKITDRTGFNQANDGSSIGRPVKVVNRWDGDTYGDSGTDSDGDDAGFEEEVDALAVAMLSMLTF